MVDPLAQLEKAEGELENAPVLEVAVHCKEKLPTNVVQSNVTIVTSPGYFHPNQFVPAVVTLSIVESRADPAYTGTGKASRSGVASVICGNAACTALLPPLTAPLLRGGVTAYVKPGAVGTVNVLLTITDEHQDRVQVVLTDDVDVTFLPVNVVTPRVTVDDVDGYYHTDQFKPAKVTLRIDESTGAPAYGGTGSATIASGNATLYEDAACRTALPQPLQAGALRTGVAAYVKGGAAGDVTVRLAITNPNDPRIRVVPSDEGVVHILPVNVVTPTVTVTEAEGYYHADQFKPAKVTLKLTESVGVPKYTGTGTATVASGTATLHGDGGCKNALGDLKVNALKGGVTAFVKGGAVGRVNVKLTLADPNHPGIRVVPNDDDDVRILPVNVVTPSVEIEAGEYFHNPDQAAPARVVLRIAESADAPKYVGEGVATVSHGTAKLWRNPGCTQAMQPLTAEKLRAKEGVTAYVKPGAAGNVTVKLKLPEPKDARVRVVAEDTDTVEFLEPNLITPVIDGDELVLVHTAFAQPGETSISEIQVSLEQSKPGRAPDNLAVRITYGNQIACFENANQTTAFATDSSLARARLGAPFPLHMRGAAQGDCTVRATVTGTAGPAWRFAEPAEKDVRVEQLTLDAYAFRDGQTIGGGGANLAGGNPKTRELHQWSANTFTFARFIMRRPSARFWTKATRVTLSVNGGAVATFSNNTATIALPNLAQGDFAAATRELWVRATAVDAMDVEHVGPIHWAGFAPALPEKDKTECHVSCGATLQGSAKELALGDLVELEAFSFDKYLDRKVYNECGARVQPNPAAAALANRCALSRAGAHKYYDRESGFWVNHADRNNGSNPFGAFIDHLFGSNNANHAAIRGANFVENHLQNEWGIALHATMKTAVRDHVRATLNGGGWAYGRNWAAVGHPALGRPYDFSLLYGVPGTHAEVLAANELLNAGVPVDAMTIATYMLQNQNGRQGKRFVACPNCSGILINGGFRVITG